jgi:hypothetical protein
MAGAIAGNGEAARAARALMWVLFAFGAVALVFLGAIYLFAPEIYLDTLMLQPSKADRRPLIVTVFLVAVVLWIVLLGVGIVRRWRWVFWLIVVAFTFSALQIPATVLELAGILTVGVPVWYSVLRALVAVIELGIGIWMLRLYRRYGVWARGRTPAKG